MYHEELVCVVKDFLKEQEIALLSVTCALA